MTRPPAAFHGFAKLDGQISFLIQKFARSIGYGESGVHGGGVRKAVTSLSKQLLRERGGAVFRLEKVQGGCVGLMD